MNDPKQLGNATLTSTPTTLPANPPPLQLTPQTCVIVDTEATRKHIREGVLSDPSTAFEQLSKHRLDLIILRDLKNLNKLPDELK